MAVTQKIPVVNSGGWSTKKREFCFCIYKLASVCTYEIIVIPTP